MTEETSDSAGLSPYISFTREQWAPLRADTPLTLDEADLERLRGINERISLREVEEVYLPLSRLLNLYVAAIAGLHRATQTFLGGTDGRVPFIIGIGGSVAVGKSTIARILQTLLSRWADHPKVDLVTTDGFLYPNSVLAEQSLLHRKGFPESYDRRALVRFVADVKSGREEVAAPVYSHLVYDILPDECLVVRRPDILILEGLNVLQTGASDEEGPHVFVSDYFDFSVYVDAEEAHIRRWYIDRFHTLRETAFRDPASYFHRYAHLSVEEAEHTAADIWDRINGRNLRANIAPTRTRASLILQKGKDHAVERIQLRRL